MNTKTISPLAAFDFIDGQARAVEDNWPEAEISEGFRWLHFDLNDDQFETWVKERLTTVAAWSLLQKETRPRCERNSEGMILNLRAVNLNPQSAPEDMVSLRIWATPSSIVSARVRNVYAIDTIKEEAAKGTGPSSVGVFLARLAHSVVSRIEAVSLELEEKTDDFEILVSEGQMLESSAVGDLRQTVIKLRRFINPQREAIANLAEVDDEIISNRELALLQETNNRTRRTVEELDAVKDRLAALQDQLDAIRSHAISRNSYILSVVAAVFLPLGFLTGLFGVNVAGMPGASYPLSFWILTGLSIASGAMLFLIFKFAKWL